MPFSLAPFASIPLEADLLEALIDEHEQVTLPRLQRLWRYYRNALAEPHAGGGSSGAPAQRAGLPDRLNAARRRLGDDRFRREIVIENDIAWRVHTLVDFMFPDSPQIVSTARDRRRAQEIEMVLGAALDANAQGSANASGNAAAESGLALWQNAALLGSAYGHVDFRATAQPADPKPDFRQILPSIEEARSPGQARRESPV